MLALGLESLVGNHLRVAGRAKLAAAAREGRTLIVAVLSRGSREGEACPIHSLSHGWDSSKEERGALNKKNKKHKELLDRSCNGD